MDDGEALALALFSSSMNPSLVSPHRSDVFSSRGVVSSPAVSIRHFSLKTWKRVKKISVFGLNDFCVISRNWVNHSITTEHIHFEYQEIGRITNHSKICFFWKLHIYVQLLFRNWANHFNICFQETSLFTFKKLRISFFHPIRFPVDSVLSVSPRALISSQIIFCNWKFFINLWVNKFFWERRILNIPRTTLHSFEPVQTAESAMNIAMVGISVFIFSTKFKKL